MKKLITWLLFLPTLIMADAVIFSGSDVKALKQNLDLFGVVKVMSGTVDPSAGGGVAAPVGSAYLSTVHGLFLKTGASNTAWTKNALLPVDLTAQVTGILPPANGGTGSSVVPANGQIPIGNGTNYAPSTITGTANQVSVTNGAGSITLTTPQDIATTSDVQFDEVTLNNAAYGPLNIGDKINRSTGTYLISGGVLSINANPALFDLSAGVGYVTDKSNPASPTLKTVTWSAFTGVTVTNLATADVTYVLINDTGNIVQQTTYPTAQQRRDNIFIGRLPHINRTNISFALSLAEYGQGGINQLYDLFDSLGPFRINGLNVSANGANLKINLSSGEMFSRSYNYPTAPENPNEVAITGSTASTFRYGTQTTFIQTNVTDIVPSSYDNAGTVTTVPANNNATIQRVYLFPTGAIRIYYGQNVYANFAAAIDNFSNDSFIENPNSQNFATHIASIVITKSCTSLQDTTCSRIVNTGKFGSGGSTGGGSTTLQQAYNNSTTPQITTSTSGGSLDIRRGSAADTDNVLRIQNGSGSATATITGAGVITGSNLSGTNTGDLTTGGDNDTPATTATIVAPNKQLTLTGTNQYRLNTGNNNELDNPNFEHSTVTTGWTISNATASGNTANPLEGKKSISLALTGALSLSQSSTINAAQKSGVQMVASIWVNSTDVSDLQLCSLKNGSEDKCTVTGGYVQGSGWRQLTVSFIGNATSNGLKLKSTDTTGTVLVDSAFVGIGSPIVNLSIDPESISYTGYLSKSGSSVRFKTLSDNSSGNLITSDNTTFTKYTALKRVTATACYTVTYTASRSDTQVVLYNSSGAVKKTWEGFYIQSGSTGGANAVCGTSIMEIGDYFTANESTATPADAKSTSFSITANALDVSKAYVASAGNQGLEAGTIIPTSAATCPAGTLAADGSPVSRTTYSELFAKIGVTHGQGDGSTTFNVPDYRGRFLRGVDGSAGNDPDKASRTAMATGGNTGNNVGSVQGDVFQGHWHNVYKGSSASANFGPSGGWSGNTTVAAIDLTGMIAASLTTDGVNGTPRASSETRPKNAYVNYCIRTTSQSTIVGSFEGIEKCATANECNDTFSAKVSSTGVVTDENTDWINGNASISDTSQFTFTFNNGVFSVAPNCVVSPSDAFTTVTSSAKPESTTSSQLVIRTGESTTSSSFTKVAYAHRIICQKQGADYFPKTAKVTLPFNEVSVRAYTTSGQSIASGATPVIVYNTEEWDNNNAFNSSTGVFTAPSSGVYTVSAYATYASASFTSSTRLALFLYKNGSSYTEIGRSLIYATTGSQAVQINGTVTVRMNQGDTLDVRTDHQEGAARSLTPTASQNNISINKIGNY